MAVASLVLGIIALFGFWIPYFDIITLIMGIVAIILAAQAKKAVPNNGIATGGLVCGIIATVLNGIGVVSCTLCVGCATCGAGIDSLF